MLYAVAGTVYSTPCPSYRAQQIYWTKTPNLRRG